ncbi:MAG: c-type cytochrome [Deltaproteobacteria bacterium]|nr:c-type cytochrome [Deltaproteobacteria bacterium]
MHRYDRRVCAILWLVILAPVLGFAVAVHAQADNELVAKGQYIFAVAGGCACHTEPKGTVHAGGRAFPIPFGKVYSTNITQDKESGLGSWTDQQIQNAMIKGIRKDGSRILPVMPYEKYSGMAQDDMRAMIAYMRTLKAVKKATPPLSTWVPIVRSLGTPLFLKVFGGFSASPGQAPKGGVQRGRYLVDHVALCGDCHTPRNFIGAPNGSLYMAGASKEIGPLGEAVPNITPDKETGIGDWRPQDIADLLITGLKPDGDNVQGLMDEVIQGTPHGYKDMTREDALAIGEYFKTISAKKNKIN